MHVHALWFKLNIIRFNVRLWRDPRQNYQSGLSINVHANIGLFFFIYFFNNVFIYLNIFRISPGLPNVTDVWVGYYIT